MRKLADRLFSISPAAADSHGEEYGEFRTNVHRFKAGAIVLGGGLIARNLGIETGADAAEIAGDVAMAAGFAVSYLSGVTLMTEGMDLAKPDRDVQ
jgi:hypothetical protein